jgi:hypothetical protein
VANADGPQATVIEECVSLGVVLVSTIAVVDVAIDFDDQPCVAAEEVDDVLPQWLLPAKLGSERATA